MNTESKWFYWSSLFISQNSSLRPPKSSQKHYLHNGCSNFILLNGGPELCCNREPKECSSKSNPGANPPSQSYLPDSWYTAFPASHISATTYRDHPSLLYRANHGPIKASPFSIPTNKFWLHSFHSLFSCLNFSLDFPIFFLFGIFGTISFLKASFLFVL